MLPTCFPSTPHPTPLQKLALRAGLEVEESWPTRRQRSGAVGRHWGQCSGAVRHWGSSRGPDHRASPTLMADLQQQQDPVLRPVLAAWTAKLSDTKERSTRALVQHYPRRFLKNGILRRGKADQRRGILAEQLVRPSSLRPDVTGEVRGYISICERCTVVPCFREREGDMMLGMVVR